MKNCSIDKDKCVLLGYEKRDTIGVIGEHELAVSLWRDEKGRYFAHFEGGCYSMAGLEGEQGSDCVFVATAPIYNIKAWITSRLELNFRRKDSKYIRPYPEFLLTDEGEEDLSKYTALASIWAENYKY